METDRVLDGDAFDRAQSLLRLLDDSVVTGDHDYRYAELRGDRRVDSSFRHRHAVERDSRQQGARHRMGTDACRARRRRVIADEDHRGEARVDPFHHPQRPGEGPHDADRYVRRKLVDQERLPVAVRIADDEFSRAGLARPLDRGEYFRRHPLSRPSVLEGRRRQLIRRRHAGDPFHVCRDVHL